METVIETTEALSDRGQPDAGEACRLILSLLASSSGVANWAVTSSRGLIASVGSDEYARLMRGGFCQSETCNVSRSAVRGIDEACMRIPLRSESGERLGTLCGLGSALGGTDSVRWEAVNLATRGLREVLSLYCALLAAQGALHELEVAANQDVTGAWNRRAWVRLVAMQAERNTRSRTSCYLGIIDLDNLKEVNDRLGHKAGDALLQQTVDILTRSVRPYDIVARLGGDEFGLLLTDCAAPLRMIRKRLTQALLKSGIAASVGLTVLEGDPDFATDLADRKMYRQKRFRKRKTKNNNSTGKPEKH